MPAIRGIHALLFSDARETRGWPDPAGVSDIEATSHYVRNDCIQSVAGVFLAQGQRDETPAFDLEHLRDGRRIASVIDIIVERALP